MKDIELKLKEKIYPMTNLFLNSVVKFKVERYYNLIVNEKDNIDLEKDKFVYKNELDRIDEPKIIVINHSNRHDFPIINNVLKKHFFILSAHENLSGIEGFIINMNGCVPVDRLDVDSRKRSSNMLEYILSKGYHILIMPEGTWNLTSNIPFLPFRFGLIDIAKSQNVKILPIILEYDYKNMKCVANIGELFDPNYYNNKLECYNALRDYLATLRWNLWDLLKDRTTFNKETFNAYNQMLLDEYPKLNYNEERKVLYKPYISYDEVSESLRKIYRK